MSEYRKVSTRLWSSPDFQSLGVPPPCLSALWLYLLTSPAMRMVPGLVLAGPGRIAEDIDATMETWTPRVVAEMLDQLQDRGMLRWDRVSRTVWLVNALGRPEHAPNDNQIKGWRAVFDEVPRSCPFRADLWQAMTDAVGNKSEHLGEPPESLESPSEAVPEAFRKASGTVPDSVTLTLTLDPTLEGEREPRAGARSASPSASPPPSTSKDVQVGFALDPPDEPPASEPPVLVFPTVGRGGGEWALTLAQVREWRSLYPALDVLAECRKALAWVTANKRKRKTPTGMPAFLVRWLNTANDRPTSARGGGRPGGGARPGTFAAEWDSITEDNLARWGVDEPIDPRPMRHAGGGCGPPNGAGRNEGIVVDLASSKAPWAGDDAA